ncbi:MAG: hypothetical protein ACRDHW_14830, partial [Ktedonobacteraceae bacterium]
AELYRAVDLKVLDRLYKSLLVAPTTHPMLIVRASEIVKWGDGSEYRDILAGRYKRKAGSTTPLGNGSEASGVNETASDRLIICPHCKRAQSNRRFCSYCGGEIV